MTVTITVTEDMTLDQKLRDHLQSTQEPDSLYKECYETITRLRNQRDKWHDDCIKVHQENIRLRREMNP